IIFFFSSRRRHTRWPRDWSSDVCFPILHLHAAPGRREPVGGSVEGDRRQRSRTGGRAVRTGGEQDLPPPDLLRHPGRGEAHMSRSEERRVGKECRSCGEWCRGREKKRNT